MFRASSLSVVGLLTLYAAWKWLEQLNEATDPLSCAGLANAACTAHRREATFRNMGIWIGQSAIVVIGALRIECLGGNDTVVSWQYLQTH